MCFTIKDLFKKKFNSFFPKECDKITVPDFKWRSVLHVARPPHLDYVDVTQAHEQCWQNTLQHYKIMNIFNSHFTVSFQYND